MSTIGSHTRTIATILTTTALVATPLAALTSSPATASGRTWKVEATGLDNPRDLVWTKSTLYVAEAGRGGSGPCLTGAEGEVCFGTSGALARIKNGHVTRVVTGLPSLAAADGSSAIGPADVVLGPGRRYVLTIGLGNDPSVRTQLPAEGQLMGTVAKGYAGTAWGKAPGSKPGKAPKAVADLAAYELANDPDGAGPDTNPAGVLLDHGGWTVADAGANTIVRTRPDGTISTVAVLGSPGTAPAPFPPFDPIAMQSVPTSVTRGPDGAYYVSELTGFPFAAGASRIIRINKSGKQSVWATGLTNVTDIDWFDGTLYAVQLATDGLLNASGLPMGSLVKVNPGATPTMIAADLPAPYGLTFGRSKAWVTTCSVCPEGGSVVSIPLP